MLPSRDSHTLPSHRSRASCSQIVPRRTFLPQAKIICLEDIIKRFSPAFRVTVPPGDVPCVSVTLVPEGPKHLSHQVAVFSAAIGSLLQREGFAACLNQPYVCWLGVVTRRTPDKSRDAQPASLDQMGQCQSSLFSQGDSRSCSPLGEGGVLAGSPWC